MELTLPKDEGYEEFAEQKKDKYQQLAKGCWDDGWAIWLLTMEDVF